MKKRILAVALTVLTLSGALPIFTASTDAAIVKRSYEEAVYWINHTLKSTNFDGINDYQCVDVIREYSTWLGKDLGPASGDGGAYNYATKSIPTAYYSRYTKNVDVQPGDIVVFGRGQYGASQKTGHVAVVASVTKDGYTCKAQGNRKALHDEKYSGRRSYTALIRPNFHQHVFTDYVCACGDWDKNSATESACGILMQITYDTVDTHLGPYTKSSKVSTLKKDAEVYAVAKVKNGFGNQWYRLSDGSYIYYDCVKKYSPKYSILVFDICRLKNKATGEYLVVSQSKDDEGHNLVTWDKTEEKGMIFTVSLASGLFGCSLRPQCSETRVLTANAASVTTATDINIKTKTDADNQVWYFQPTDDGYIIRNAANSSCVLAGNGSHKSVILQNYTGKSNQIWIKETVSGHVHNYTEEKIIKKAACTEEGIKELGCSCGEKIQEYIPATGHSYKETIIPATCTENAYRETKCTACGETSTVRLGGGISYSEWSLVKPAVPDEKTETKTVYRYKTGGEKQPVKKSEGQIEFASYNGKMTGSSFPAGFNTSSSFYAKYNNTPVTASSDENGRTDVEYKLIGYIYWHWCYGTYTAGPINRKISSKKTDQFKSFHAFFSSNDIPLTVSANARKSANGAVCKDTHWWLDERVPVYRCTYTVYEYSGGEASWSDTKPAAVQGKEIESAIMYREIITDEYTAAGHKWDAGRITSQPTPSATGIKTYTCKVCGKTKTETIPKTASGIRLGDVDANGKIDIVDARLCLRRAIKLESYKAGSDKFIACDIDCNSQVSIQDARSILRVAIKLDNEDIWQKKIK